MCECVSVCASVCVCVSKPKRESLNESECVCVGGGVV